MSFGPLNRRPGPGFSQEPQPGRIADGKIYVGIIKNNVDVQRMGRLEVWIPDIGGDPEDKTKWFLVSYASPFAGATDIEENTNDQTYRTQKSYGMWMVPPDINNQVLVFFLNGEAAKGIWFACLWQQNMNHMVPGIASNVSSSGGSGALPPVQEYNKLDQSVNVPYPNRPAFEPLRQGLAKQGLTSDFKRGPSSSSARREAPSQVFGFLTPRSNQLYVDDDPDNEFIRIRTRSGTQVLVHETDGLVYINSGKGNSWIEISDAGVDIYSKGNISLRSEQDVNIRADQNINLDAGANINMKASGGFFGKVGSNFHVTSGTTMVFGAGGTFNAISGTAMNLQSSGDVNVASGAAFKASASTISQKADKISRDGSIRDNMGVSEPAGLAIDPVNPEMVEHTDAGRNISATVSRMPTHEPWSGHPKNGSTGPSGGVKQDVASNPSDPKSYDSKADGTGGEVVQKTGEGDGKKVQVYESGESVSVGNFKVDSKVVAAIAKAASITGIDFGFLMAMAEKESGFRPNAQAKTSSAGGLYQFIDDTWAYYVRKYGAKHGITLSDKFDPEASAIMAGYMASENRSYIAYATKRPKSSITPTELYLGHFLGGGGAAKLLNANQNDSAVAVCGTKAANANKSIFYNKSGAPNTAQDVVNIFTKFIEPRVVSYNNTKPPPMA